MTLDIANANSNRGPGVGDCDLIDSLAYLARRIRVGDIARNERQPRLVGVQAGNCSGERL